jgi:Domain of unknown function (DUF1902)
MKSLMIQILQCKDTGLYVLALMVHLLARIQQAHPALFTCSLLFHVVENPKIEARVGTTLDELLEKISAMTLDLLPDNHPGVDPASVYLQITALREVDCRLNLLRHKLHSLPTCGHLRGEGAQGPSACETSSATILATQTV